MNRGSKPEPDEAKVLRGTFRSDRGRAGAIAPLSGEPVPPRFLDGLALEVWDEKVGIYNRRGQSVVGCEAALAQYCQIEADLITRRQEGIDVPVALINAYRIYANEFYDTPASQQAAGVKRGAGNRFANNGRRAERAAQ